MIFKKERVLDKDLSFANYGLIEVVKVYRSLIESANGLDGFHFLVQKSVGTVGLLEPVVLESHLGLG